VPPRKTLLQTKHTYRTGALAAAVAHGVDVGRVEEALAEMGCGRDNLTLPVGQGVTVSTVGGGAPGIAIPSGTVAFTGNPKRPATLGVFRWDGLRWTHLFGDRTYVDQSMVVESVNGVIERPAWLDEAGTDADEDAIREWKAVAWQVGWKLKKSMGWCGTYEQIAHGLGVTQADQRATRYRGFARGQRITRDEAASLPVGSVLWWQHSEDETKFAAFVRRAEATNRAGTVRVFASPAVSDNENCKHYMTVAGINRDDEMGSDFDLAPYGSARVFPLLPPVSAVPEENRLPTIESVVRQHYDDPATPPPEALVQALVERENTMADMFRMAGIQFGLYPQIMAEVFAEVGIGSPISPEQRQMVRTQFIALMQEFERQQREG
jgi:hypothetical protein